MVRLQWILINIKNHNEYIFDMNAYKYFPISFLDTMKIVYSKEVLMTHEKFKKYSKIVNILVSIFIPIIILSGVFYDVLYSIENDIADGVFGFSVLILFVNGGLTLGTLIYMISKKQHDLLSRLLWMIANEILLLIATVVSVIIALSGS